jgi:YggT family protein
MLTRILLLLIETIAGFLSFAFLARFFMQWARVSFYNPVGQFVMAVTDWAVKPARRVIPGLWGLDLASLLLAWLVQGLGQGLMLGLVGGAAVSPAMAPLVALLSLFAVLRTALWLVMVVVLVSAVLSWVNPYAPAGQIFNALAAPMLRPFRRLIPPIGGVDLSPLVLLLLLQVAQIVLDSLQATALGSLMLPSLPR